MKERIICLVTPESRSYYRALPLAKEFLDKDRSVVNIAGALPEGEVEEFDIRTKTLKHYKNGKLDGKLEVMDLTTGEVTLSETYKDGVLTDITDRTLHGQTPVKKAAPQPQYDGTVIKVNKATQSFYRGGKEVAEQTVAANGASLELLGSIPDGPAKEFDENGLLRSDAAYKDNKLDGELIRYDEKGRILSSEHYVQGQLQGTAQYYAYFGSGPIKTTAQYKNALLHGERITYFPDGSVCMKENYKNGKLHGEKSIWYPMQAGLQCQENFQNGKLTGKRILYFPQGGVWYEENYKNGRLDGERLSYFPSGQKRLAEFYAEGLLEGTRHIYAENGELLTNEEYHWGTLLHNTERKPL